MLKPKKDSKGWALKEPRRSCAASRASPQLYCTSWRAPAAYFSSNTPMFSLLEVFQCARIQATRQNEAPRLATPHRKWIKARVGPLSNGAQEGWGRPKNGGGRGPRRAGPEGPPGGNPAADEIIE